MYVHEYLSVNALGGGGGGAGAGALVASCVSQGLLILASSTLRVLCCFDRPGMAPCQVIVIPFVETELLHGLSTKTVKVSSTDIRVHVLGRRALAAQADVLFPFWCELVRLHLRVQRAMHTCKYTHSLTCEFWWA